MVRTDEQGWVWIDGVKAHELAEEYGTPLYVYSEQQIKDNISTLKKAISKHFQSYRIQYAIKANSNPHIVGLIRKLGLGADCSSPAEAQLAQSLGFAMERSTYTGNYESPTDFQIPLDHQMVINLDHHRQLPVLLSQGTRPPVLSFRINPGIGRGGFEGIVTGGNDAKFGLPYAQTEEAYRMAQAEGFQRFGIHMMTGSNILEPYYFAEVTQKLLSIIEHSLCPLGIQLEFINIGGGLGIPYSPGERALDVEQTFMLVAESFHHKVSHLGIGSPALVIEPGRYIVGNAGVLLSRVLQTKESYRNYMGLDSSMSTLLRPSLYRAYHRIQLDGKLEQGKKPYYACGQICENSDIHPQERLLLNPTPGDLAVIFNAGAYGFAMSSHYNNRPRPAEVMVGAQGPRLIREREQNSDLFSRVPHFFL